jgi:hypothetical protein
VKSHACIGMAGEKSTDESALGGPLWMLQSGYLPPMQDAHGSQTVGSGGRHGLGCAAALELAGKHALKIRKSSVRRSCQLMSANKGFIIQEFDVRCVVLIE